ncbi:MAG: translesion error-prone DNA polymerase V autoproteolytic subunit [Nitrospirota bacterium]
MHQPDRSFTCERPLFVASIPAGFPSPADDYVEGTLDLNQHLIKHPAATFFVRVTGDSMIDAGIHPGDLLIVDRALTPAEGDVVIAVLDGELTVKRLQRVNAKPVLVADNRRYPPIRPRENQEFEMWGVVTYVIHKV